MQRRLMSAVSVPVGEALVPGAAFAVTDCVGLVAAGGAGVRAVGAADDMSPDTVVWLGSLTKPVTAVAALQLVEQGELRLDEPASDVLPAIGEVQVLDGFDADGEPRLRPPAGPITLRALLTHTAGFGHEVWSEELGRYESRFEAPMLCDPGTRWL